MLGGRQHAGQAFQPALRARRENSLAARAALGITSVAAVLEILKNLSYERVFTTIFDIFWLEMVRKLLLSQSLSLVCKIKTAPTTMVS